MADNTELNAGSGGDTISTDDISGIKVQRVKVQYGVDGAATDVSDTNPMPIDDAGGSLTVDIGAASTAAGDLAKAEDAVHGSGDVGVMPLAVRNDTLASLVGADGDYAPLQVDASGALFVNVDSGVGGTHVDDAAFTPGTDDGVPSMFMFDDTAPDSVDENDAGIGRMSANRNQYQTIRDAAGNERGVNVNASNQLAIAGPVTNAGTFAVQISDTSFAVADGNALGEGVLVQGDDGTDRKNINVDATTGDVQVDVTNTVTVDGSGVTQPVSGTVTANLSATDNAVLDNIQTSVDTVAAAVSTEMQVDVVGALPTGSNSIGTVALSATDNAVLDTIDAVLDLINAKLVTGTVIGDVNLGATDNAVLDSIAANLLPATSGGISTVYRDEDIDETAVALKASTGQIYWIHCINFDATPVYLHFYNVAQGSVTVGTTGELCSFAVPSQGDANGAGFTMHFDHGIEFGTAITVACTTAIGGTSGPGTNEVILNVGYE